ncbi:MAG: NAD(P)/FAD-dependent oxidoreductase [Polyangiales bacterium]
MTSTLDCIVIGAGPSGLAVGACLKHHGVNAVILERETSVAPNWRKHYDRLHLHTFRDLSALPFKKWRKGTPAYPSREQVVEYMQEYADEQKLRIEFGVEITHVERDGEEWVLTAGTNSWRARALVIATGYNRTPFSPRFNDQEQFEGEIIHSSRYRSGAPYQGKNVLVVGSGNSGAEIAIDLFEHGAKPSICIRGPVHVAPREVHGIPAQIASLVISRLPRRLGDALALSTSKLHYGDLSAYGIVRPEIGPISSIADLGRVPMVDIGTIELIKGGHLRVVPGIESFDRTGIKFTDGRRFDFDAVVLATGYDATIEEFMPEAASLIDERGYPKLHDTQSSFPGPYFIGFGNPPTGQIHAINRQSQRIAKEIHKQLANAVKRAS